MARVNFFERVIEYVIHLDANIADLVEGYGLWAYALLFAIIFCETGLVVTPFLPGDSLLFAAGAVVATGVLNIGVLLVLLIVAAVAGDSLNYWIGSKFGTRAFKEDARILKLDYLRRTEDFFRRYGGKTIVVARFVPIVRTYAPFVAGVGSMNYARFLRFNVTGGILWITLFLLGGYLFGAIPFVQDNFALLIVAVIILSVVPMIFEYAKTRRARRIRARVEAESARESSLEV